MKLEYLVTNTSLSTINEMLKNEFHFSQRLMKKLIDTTSVHLNHEICDTRSPISIGDKITIFLDNEEDSSNVVPTPMKLEIVYEDNWLLIVNKPAGITIHPSMQHYSDSLSNGVRHYFDCIHLKKKVRPVNRLDYDTSGLVIFAKCEYIQERFSNQMAVGKFKKNYLACIKGPWDKEKKGTINLPIGRKPGSIIERIIDTEHGQTSITQYEIIEEKNDLVLVQCGLETGRTHQIRVHLAAIRSPFTW